jgi:hypothetical protein
MHFVINPITIHKWNSTVNPMATTFGNLFQLIYTPDSLIDLGLILKNKEFFNGNSKNTCQVMGKL